MCSKCGGEVGLTARQCSCGHRVVAPKLDEDPQRLSLQLYGNLTTDANVLKELSVPRSDGLQLTKEEQEASTQLISRSLSSRTALYLLSVHNSFKKKKKNRKKSRVGCCGSNRSVVHMTSPCTTRFSSLESLEHGHSVLVVEDGKKQE